MEGHEPTLKTPAMQRELRELARNGIDLGLREVEQTEPTTRNKKRGSNMRPQNDSTNSMEDKQMEQSSAQGTPSGNRPNSEPVNEQNWPLHVEARLKQIGQTLESQNSTGATVKNALVTTGAVLAGTLAAHGVLKLGSWIFTPSPVKAVK